MGAEAMKTETRCTVTSAQENPVDLLAAASTLAKKRIRDAMAKGAVSLTRNKSTQRIRKASTPLKPGDLLALHYDARLLALNPPRLQCLDDRMGYSLWFKPPGVMAQGNEYGDHMALLRLVEQHFKNKRQVYLVHRLDRETRGLMLVAHNKKMAAIFSALFQENEIKKIYQAIVKGDVASHLGNRGTLDTALDGKNALTHFEVRHYEQGTDTSHLQIRLETGRTHQIRRHLSLAGHPIMGDPKYGRDNKNRQGLMLAACELSFTCPIYKQPRHYQLPEPVFKP